MASLSVQRSLTRSKPASNSERGEMVRCPHCSQHFNTGGAVSPEDGAHEFDQEHGGEMRFARETREYDRELDHYYDEGEAGFAAGGRVDGAGKVDGIHLHPSECSHLAAGGVCRHLAPSRRRRPGEDYADDKPRNFAKGGRAGSFTGYLAQRRYARKGASFSAEKGGA